MKKFILCVVYIILSATVLGASSDGREEETCTAIIPYTGNTAFPALEAAERVYMLVQYVVTAKLIDRLLRPSPLHYRMPPENSCTDLVPLSGNAMRNLLLGLRAMQPAYCFYQLNPMGFEVSPGHPSYLPVSPMPSYVL